MARPDISALSGRDRARYTIELVTAAVVSTTLVLLVYFVLPLDRFAADWFWATMLLSLMAFAALAAYEVRAILRSRRPVGRAVRAMATSLPLFVVIFAAAYYMMSKNDAGSFNEQPLTKLDCLYFTTTVLTTVGFGDIAATSQFARGVVTVQEVLDLLVIGLVIRVFVSAVQEAWRRRDLLKEPGDPAAAVEGAPPAPPPAAR
jgi:voltage-gated potassium channel